MGWTTIQSQNLGEANTRRMSILGAGISGAMSGIEKGSSLKKELNQDRLKEDLANVGDVTEIPSVAVTDSDGNPTTETRPAGSSFGGKTYATQEEAGAAQTAAIQGIYRKHGDTEGASRVGRDAQQAALTGIQLDDARQKGDLAKRRAGVDQDVADYVKINTKIGKDGKTVVSAPSPVDILNRRRDAFAGAGLMDDAIASHKQARDVFVQDWEINKIKRGQEIDEAITSARKGDWTKAQAIYKMIPDGVEIVNARTDLTAKTADGKIPVFGDVIKDGKKTGGTQFLGYEDDLIKGINSVKDASTAVKMIDDAFAQSVQLRELGMKERQTKADEKRANAAVISAGKAEARAAKQDARQDKIDAANVKLAEAERTGDPQQIRDARNTLAGLGVRLEKPEGTKGSVVSNPMGGAFIYQTGSEGRVTVTPVTMSGEKGKTVHVGVPGGDGATASVVPSQKAIDMLKNNPALAAQFDDKYGAGSSKKYVP